MTTLVTIRQALELLSMSDQQTRRTSKRLAASAADAQDGGFQLSRKAKWPRTDEQKPVKKKASRGRPPTKARAGQDSSTATETPLAVGSTRKSTRRRSSVDAPQAKPPPSGPRRATRRSKRLSGEVIPKEAQENGNSGNKKGRGKIRVPRLVEEDEEDEEDELPQVQAALTAKIALPMSDTPIINRNKEMRRKGNSSRRSSLGSRGRRASSLIDSGQTAIPHREVDAAEFYKHIAAEGLPEPRRMKQLLMWCGERVLSEKPPHGTPNSSATLGARAIQDQLLKDFASRPELSDWFSREEISEAKPALPRKPNPRNIELDEKIMTLEARIKRLQEEKKTWLAIEKSARKAEPVSAEETEEVELPDADLLDADEGSIRDYLADPTNSFSSVRSTTEVRLRTIQSSLEFEVDQMADSVHKLEQFVGVAGKEADKVLQLSAARLRARDLRDKTDSGTRDLAVMEILRSLSRILPEGDGGG